MNKFLEIFRDHAPIPSVIKGSLPVPFFGQYDIARVATVGLNPSKWEFKHRNGEWRLAGEKRLESLESLGVSHAQNLTDAHLELCYELCRSYFQRNIYYRTYFDRVGNLIRPLNVDYKNGSLAHFDVSPWATDPHWNDLSPEDQRTLAERGKTLLRLLLASKNLEIAVFFTKHSGEMMLGALDQPFSILSLERGSGNSRFFSGSVTLQSNRELKILGCNLRQDYVSKKEFWSFLSKKMRILVSNREFVQKTILRRK